VPADQTGRIEPEEVAPAARAAPASGASSPSPAAPPVPPKVRAALGRYRVAAFVVGWGLLVLVATMVAKYGFGQDWMVEVWGPIHGVLYVGYVLLAFDLAYKDRWSLPGILWVLVAGVIPGVSFVAERQVHRKVLARQKI
jgi:integral membrane protein